MPSDRTLICPVPDLRAGRQAGRVDCSLRIRKRRGTAAVKITTSHGRCFLLWAPCDRPIAMSDRGFPGKAQRIMGYWQWMAQAPPGDVSERDLQQEAPDAS
jgi:hypothetical protein